jgi:hypothetical protein
MPLIGAGRLTNVSLTAMGVGFHLGYRAQTLVCAGLLILLPVLVMAQSAPAADKQAEPGFLSSVGRWFDQQVSGAKDTFNNLGREAGMAARSTADSAKDAANSLANKLPSTTVVSGHEVCKVAPNGAPDCVAAAAAICKTKGFKFGKSVDMTTAETCPAKIYMAGRSAGPECKTETFVSSALCQ